MTLRQRNEELDRKFGAQATRLRQQMLTYAEIGAAIGLSAIDARDIVRRFESKRKLEKRLAALADLPERAVLNLVTGRYGPSHGADIRSRLERLRDIAQAYTWEELLEEEGIGRTTATVIRLWLEVQGLSLRTRPTAELPSERPLPGMSETAVRAITPVSRWRFPYGIPRRRYSSGRQTRRVNL